MLTIWCSVMLASKGSPSCWITDLPSIALLFHLTSDQCCLERVMARLSGKRILWRAPTLNLHHIIHPHDAPNTVRDAATPQNAAAALLQLAGPGVAVHARSRATRCAQRWNRMDM